MADSAYFPRIAVRATDVLDSSRHSVLVRVTHWINALSFVGLVVSGVAILLAHPRLYWGETGAVGLPSLLDLPLPFMLTGQSGWGRSLHFQSAWVCVITGSVYVISGLLTRHFRNDFVGAAADPGDQEGERYSVLQGRIYLGVVFVLFPLMIWTGLAMSPAVTSVFPSAVTILGGQQSARTIHFFAASALVLFLFVHVGMVSISGFSAHMRAMITGRGSAANRQHA